MKLAKKRKMIAVNPINEVEPIRYKVKGFKDWSDAEFEQFIDCYPIVSTPKQFPASGAE
jgi:hypothetical protein